MYASYATKIISHMEKELEWQPPYVHNIFWIGHLLNNFNCQMGNTRSMKMFG